MHRRKSKLKIPRGKLSEKLAISRAPIFPFPHPFVGIDQNESTVPIKIRATWDLRWGKSPHTYMHDVCRILFLTYLPYIHPHDYLTVLPHLFHLLPPPYRLTSHHLPTLTLPHRLSVYESQQSIHLHHRLSALFFSSVGPLSHIPQIITKAT